MTAFILRLLFVAGLLTAGVSGPAAANALHDFLADSAVAYGHYRTAASYLRTGNTDLAALELEQAGNKWKALNAHFAATPPDAFADDPKWRETLHEIGARLKGALAEIDEDRTDDAAKTLAPVRAMLGDLRRRNGIWVFSDRINELSDAMNRLWRFRKAPPDFAVPKTLRELREGTAVLGYLFGRVRAEAPKDIAGTEDFTRMVDGAQEAIGRMWHAIDTADTDLLINTLRELRAFDNLLYLKFG
jgi:hypothetical protein